MLGFDEIFEILYKAVFIMLFRTFSKKALFIAAMFFLTSSLRTPKIFVKEFSYFLMPCHQHGLGVNLLVQR